jgi:predicted unusual protein kinase regulating ubiquinone biosynthesis (AarF/ABC1/UbiB family)
MYYNFAHLPHRVQQSPEQVGPVVNPKLVENPKTFWEKVCSFVAHTVRFLHLMLIFLPPILALPLRLFKRTEQAWLGLFVGAVERAGVVWIKAFQYLSHRRDVIGPAMAEAFTHLREHAPQHSFEETKRNFKLSYGKEISEIFSSFDPEPIASGSVSQVYKAVYRGKKVAVKVRHPEVDKYIQRDVNILFGISRFLSLFSKTFEIPVGESSLKKTLVDQIDFNIEKENLATFNRHFIGNQHVNFPYAFEEETRDSILI